MNLFNRSFLLATVAVAAGLAAAPLRAATFTVTNINNAGAGSFRQAIIDANANPGADTIDFNIPGPGPHTISPTSFLPAFTDQVTVDGYSQPGAARATGWSSATILIELDGSSAGENVGGLYFFTNSGNSRLSGLAINNFNRVGVYLLNSEGTQIDGNYIGCDPSGTIAKGNIQAGIEIQQWSSDSTVVGGTSVGERNVISGNDGDGVAVVNSNYCTIKGNYIGTDANGIAFCPNTGDGLDIYGSYAMIGGAPDEQRNIISGNTGNGIKLSYAQHCDVIGNYIGTDWSGLSALGNGGHGIDHTGDYAAIGGSGAGEENVISGNYQQGINLTASTHNTIVGNHLGTDLDGTAALPNHWSGICLTSSSDDNTIGGETAGERNLISGNLIYGVDIQGSTGVVVKGNHIGTNANGNSALGNGSNGVSISHSANGNTIGGSSAGQGNLISGNTYVGVGIYNSHNNVVEGNCIGTDYSGTFAIGNDAGVYISDGAHDNRIGGPASGQRNIISGNDYGVFLTGCSGNIIQGNYIGTNVYGTLPVANSKTGIFCYQNCDDNDFGGAGAGEGNVISGNTHYGIEIDQSSGNTVVGNFIGTDKNGTGALANGDDGVYLHGTSDDNTFGGETDGAGNVIAHNGKTGITIASGTGNAILFNSIFSNTDLGIDLGGDGVTPNDPDDPDSGPNRLQNFPEMTAATLLGSDLQVSYSVPSIEPNSTYPLTIEFFTADDGEGKTFLGSKFYSETGPATALFTPATEVNHGDEIVSTATDAGGNSSEFSAAAVVAPTSSLTPTPSPPPTATATEAPTTTPTPTPSITPTASIAPTASASPIASLTPEPSPTPTIIRCFNISGMVSEKTTQIPMADAAVRIIIPDGVSPIAFTTETGMYRASVSTHIQEGAIQAQARLRGYLPGSAESSYSDWTDVSGLNIELVPSTVEQGIGSGDYNGDGTSEIAIFRPGNGLWAVRGFTRIYFGSGRDDPIAADYDGDGTSDIAVFRGSSGLWAVRNITRLYFGCLIDMAIPGDYSGDESCDIGIFRNKSGLWAIRGLTRIYFGMLNDEPVPGYYNGDGTEDIGIFRPVAGLWALRGISRIYFGSSNDTVVPGDYQGDGIWETAIFRSTSGLWAIRGVTRNYFGSSIDEPLPADYDGDGGDDIGIFRETTGLWAIRGITRVYYGTSEDIPVTR